MTETVVLDNATYEATTFDITVDNHTVTTHLISPPADRLAPNPALLVCFAHSWDVTLLVDPYNLTSNTFLREGHRVVAFDLPHHGERIGQAEAEISGFRDAALAGRDDFGMCVREAIAVIDHCVENKLAMPGRVVACGTSRGGYLSLRLLAADPRVSAVAAYAPPTDWRPIREFADCRDRPEIAELRLEKTAMTMGGKRAYLSISYDDDRVDTPSCLRYCTALLEDNKRRPDNPFVLRMRMDTVPGHGTNPEWHDDGAKFLFEVLTNTG